MLLLVNSAYFEDHTLLQQHFLLVWKEGVLFGHLKVAPGRLHLYVQKHGMKARLQILSCELRSSLHVFTCACKASKRYCLAYDVLIQSFLVELEASEDPKWFLRLLLAKDVTDGCSKGTICCDHAEVLLSTSLVHLVWDEAFHRVDPQQDLENGRVWVPEGTQPDRPVLMRQLGDLEDSLPGLPIVLLQFL